MRKLLSLLLASLMLLSLFSFAQADELKTVTLFGEEAWGLCTWEETQNTKSWAVLQEMAAARGIRLEPTVVPSEQIVTVLQASIMQGNLADFFQTEDLSTADQANLIESGLIRPVEEILKYSDGTAVKAYEEGWMKDSIPHCTYSDGKLWFLCDQDHYTSIEQPEYRMAIPGNTLHIRQDWLDKLGLPMPTTLDELFNTLVAFNENDVNGDGTKNERMILDMHTCGGTWGGFFDSGLAQRFGLANYMFQLNRETGKAEIPVLQEGYAAYVEFLKKCVDAGVLYLSDDAGKQDTNAASIIAQNVVSVYFANASGNTAGLPEGANYQSLPMFDAVDGIKSVTANALFADLSYDSFAFSAAGDIEAQAALLDLFCSKEYAIWYSYGQEGITYNIDENGTYKYIGATSVADVVESGYGRGRYFGYSGFLPNIGANSYIDSYKGQAMQFADFDELLNSEYYKEVYYPSRVVGFEDRCMAAIEEAKALLNYLPNPDRKNTVPIATAEEAEILDQYEADVYTFVDEMNHNLVTGNYDIANLDQYLEELKGLGLEECLKVYQAMYDRYLAAKSK